MLNSNAVPTRGKKPPLYGGQLSVDRIPEAHRPGNEAPARDLRLTHQLLRISKAIRAIMAIKLAKIAFVPGQDQLMMQLDASHPVSVSSLATSLMVRPSTVSKMIDRLEQRGMLRRLSDGTDGRRSLIEISAQGIKAQTAIRSVWKEVESELSRDLLADGTGQIAADLEVIDRTLIARLNRLR